MKATIGTSIAEAAALLLADQCIGMPTETVYGLAANALSEQAVLDVFRIKERPDFDPLIVHTFSLTEAAKLAAVFPENAAALARRFWPGPLTLVLPKTAAIPYAVTSGLDTVGLRVPAHPMALELLRATGFPLAAPSANPFGYVSPTTAQHVADQLGHRISYILDGGACSVGLESTILGFEEEGPVIYRLGYISQAMIEAVIGPVRVAINASSDPKAPGMIRSHYAPGVPVLSEHNAAITDLSAAAYLGFDAWHPLIPKENQLLLSPSSDLFEAARNLYAGLRMLDRLPVRVIVAAKFPETGIGSAINDRLGRASAV